jgi:hypothetical protein
MSKECMMHDSLVDLFPCVHSVLVLTVSHLQCGAVKLSLQIFPEDDLESDRCSNSEEDDTLTKHRCAILEFFIAKLHLCSQKNMSHWAMVMPLLFCHGIQTKTQFLCVLSLVLVNVVSFDVVSRITTLGNLIAP